MSTSGCDCTSRRVTQPSHRDSYDNQCTEGLNAQCFIAFLETALVMKCRKGREASLQGRTTFIPNSHLAQTPYHRYRVD